MQVQIAVCNFFSSIWLHLKLRQQFQLCLAIGSRCSFSALDQGNFIGLTEQMPELF